MSLRSLLFVLAPSLALVGCGGEWTVGNADGSDALELDSALVTESADRGCGVVLREVARVVNSNGSMDQSCVSTTGICYQAWTAYVDVSNELVAKGGKGGIAYKVDGSSTTYRVTGSLVGDAKEPGFKKFKVRFWRNVMKTSLNYEEQQKVRFSAAAYATFPDSTRKVDRNRVVGLSDSLTLSAANGWRVSDDATTCHPSGAPRAYARFLGGYTQERSGTPVRGGKLVVEYDPYRMPQCMGSTYMGLPAWATVAYVRFSPGAQLATLPVVARVEATSTWAAMPAEFDIPADATSADVWFYTSGRNCTGSWDSNYGDNYKFPVAANRPQNVLWAGDFGGSFSRSCEHVDGLQDPITLTSYNRERTCMWVDAEAWAPGVTDAATVDGSKVLAQVQYSIDGAAPVTVWPRFTARDGNNYRYQFTLPDLLRYQSWTKLQFRYRFSTDGVNWVNAAGAGDAPRTVVHDATW